MAETKKYLDYTGLTKLVQLIKSYFVTQDDLESNYSTSTQIAETYITKTDAEKYIDESDLTNKLADYSTSTQIAGTYITKTDAEKYIDKSELSNKLADYLHITSQPWLSMIDSEYPTTGWEDLPEAERKVLDAKRKKYLSFYFGETSAGYKFAQLNVTNLNKALSDVEDKVNNLSNAVHFIGVTTTALEDGSTINSIKINNKDYTPTNGDIVIVNKTHKELVYYSNKWYELGDTSAISNALTNLDKKLYGEDGKGGDINTLTNSLGDLQTNFDNLDLHEAMPETGTNSITAAFEVGMGITK